MRVIQSSFLRTVVKLFVVTICLVKSFMLFSQELKYDEYKVKANDTLIHILKKHSLRPVYGPNGSLAETLELNPEKKKHNGDLIYTGETLKLPSYANWKKTELSKKQRIMDDEYAKNDPTHKKHKNRPEDQSTATVNEKVVESVKEKAKENTKNTAKESVKETQSTFVEQSNSSKVEKREQSNFLSESKVSQKPETTSANKYKTAVVPEVQDKENAVEQSENQSENNLSPYINNIYNFSEMPNFEFFKESLKYCIIVPACKIGFQEHDLKCCKKPKPLFFTNQPEPF